MSQANGPSKGGMAAWYSRLAAFNVEDLFSRKRPPGPPRTIYVNSPIPADWFAQNGKVKKEHLFTPNQVITSKYTIITFLPRNLLEQFRRIANIFFLFIAILQFFPKFATISPGAVILPLLVILAVTALKDGYEDYKRHQSDRRVNYSKVDVLSGGGWTNPNHTEAKSKTFIRAIVPSGKKIGKPDDKARRGDVGVEVDYEGGNLEGTPEKAHWSRTKWEDVRVGDFVKIRNNESIPADILVCATSEEENVAFVETMNLDGETNLKSRRGVQSLSHLRNAKECADPGNAFHINCDRPDNDMYRLNANVTFDGETASVDLSTTLLRGTVLRNTEWVIGIVLFTGLDSKIVQNSGGTPSKRSKVERQMNPQVFINLLILAVMAVVCAIADSMLELKFFPLGAPWLFGDDHSDDNPRINGLVTWAFALLTFQDIVPISLYISIEFVKTCQAAWIYFDGEIYYEKTKRATMARSWNLSDDLGQIEYIFSDKTGTLTQNLMLFRKCSIGGKAYRGDDESAAIQEEKSEIKAPSITSPEDKAEVHVNLKVADSASSGASSRQPPQHQDTEHFRDSVLALDIQAAAEFGTAFDRSGRSQPINAFFTVLGLCHTVLAAVNPQTAAVEYKAQSPDEAALVQAASDIGFTFLGKDKEILSLRTPYSSSIEKYELLDILEFTSARKRMSVVARQLGKEDGQLFLLTKGADNVIFERLGPGQDDLKGDTEHDLSEFANEGLRTLTLAYRTIPEREYAAWSTRYHEATVALDNREERVESVSNELEQNLILLGATAIEDKLQDGVPETIRDLKKAGIKIWVATGDKMETAIAIGRSTTLIRQDSNIIILRGGSRPVNAQMVHALEEFFPEQGDPEKLKSSPPSPANVNDPIPLHRINTGFTSIVGAENGDRPGGFVLVVDGSALLETFNDDDHKLLLLRLANLCEGVICCRVSPLQKALIVRLVKDGLGAMTLAIGDGANDVSMIQAADVGVGIAGEEGLQAVNSSDYSIAQFRFLKKLLLVHGHWSYARNGVMILNFFYKNIVPTGILWWFQIYSAWSGYYVFDYTYILFWNSLWTIVPVIGIGLFDRFLDARVLMQVPELYRYGREGKWFGLKSFAVYMFDGIVQSALIFFLILYAYQSPSARRDGYDVYLYEFSTTMALSAVLVVDIFTGSNGTAWTWWLVFAVFIGIIVQWVFTIIYSLISPGYAVTRLFGNDYFLFTSAYFWLCLPLTFILSMAPRMLYKAWRFAIRPGDLEIFQILQKQLPGEDFSKYSAADGDSPLSAFKPNRVSTGSRMSSLESIHHPFTRPSMDVRSPSRMDMSTGRTSMDRGFDFVTEEYGVQMQRVQTNLSEARMSKQNLGFGRDKGKEGTSRGLSLGRGFMRKKVPS